MMPIRNISLCLVAVMAASKTEAGLVGDYPFPVDSEIPDSDMGMAYSPLNFATISSLDLDMRSIDAYVSSNTQSGLDAAKNIFEKGGFSDSYANLMILDPDGQYASSETNIIAGAKVIGTSVSGASVTGIAKFGKTETLNGSGSSENILQVHYPTVALEDTNSGCFVGGNPTPITDGCFAPSGKVTITGLGYTYEFEYSYEPTLDNVNGLTLDSLDRLRGKSVSVGVEPETLRKYLSYYGDSVYYDQDWIKAAFDGTATTGSNGIMDFSHFGLEGRSAAVRTGLVALRIWFFAMNSIDDAVGSCGTVYAVNRWDHAVAAYSGSVPIQTTTQDYSLGYFLFTLAQTQCKFFGTCDPNTGVAKVNQDAFEAFRNGREQLVNNDCANAGLSAKKLRSLLGVPLVQGILKETHDIDLKEITRERGQGEGVAYAAAMLPLLSECNPGNAYLVWDNMNPGSFLMSSFEVVKDAMERAYDCLGITCEDVGGLVAYGDAGWLPGAEPCGSINPPTKQPAAFTPTPPSPSDDDDNYVSSSGGATTPAWKDDDDYKLVNKSQGDNKALLIGLFSGLGVLAAIIAIVVACIDSKRAKEFDTGREPTSASQLAQAASGDSVEEEDILITSSAQVV